MKAGREKPQASIDMDKHAEQRDEDFLRKEFIAALSLSGDERVERLSRLPKEARLEIVELIEAMEEDGAEPAADLDSESSLIGTRIGNYEIEKLIGRGGLGAVYRARRVEDFEKTVAIKVLRAGMEDFS